MEKQFTVTEAGRSVTIPANRCTITSEGGKVRIDVLAAEGLFDAIIGEVYPDQNYDEVSQLRREAKSPQ
ncbi:MAG: hypothetical protein ACRYG7_07740 [Janthinobacterium lividum]